MNRRVMAVLAAVVVGLVGVVAVVVYAGAADARAVAGQHVQTVFVTAKLVPSGTSAADAVAQGLIVSTQAAAQGVPAGALTKVDATTGRLLALTDIAPGEFVFASRFGATPLGQSAIAVPAGQVAISLTLADPARVGTFLTPGSHIVIYDTYVSTAAGAAGDKETRVLLDDVLVIAMGSASLSPSAPSSGGQAATTGDLVTVALAPDAATKLVHGVQTGTLYAGLRGAETKSNLGLIVTDSTLFNK